MRLRYLIRFAFLFAALVAPLALTACAAGTSQTMTMPDFVQAAPPRVKDAYLYAVAQPDDLAAVPCYCGCGSMGHKSNLSCFINGNAKEATTVFEPHASGCGICVDIAQDVKRLRAEGKTRSQVRTAIDATYSSYGPGTDTPLPKD
jgi:Protein of unknown function with PCYCGC motif